MSQVMGTAVNRKDGRAKVTGAATYAAEHDIPNLVHGYLITAQIAKGQIKAMDTRLAKQAPGVLEVFTHTNVPRIFTPDNDFVNSKIYEARLPLADNQIHYGGQIIGLVVADSLERARHAAHLVQVDYRPETPVVEANKAVFEEALSLFGKPMAFATGAFATEDSTEQDFAAVARDATTIAATYTTSNELHAPMEPHAIIAHWQGRNSLTVYEPSQWVSGTQRTYAQLFGLAPEHTRIVSPYIGGGFGCKAVPWPHGILCVAAARQLQRPVKVVVSRRQMTANTGHRSETEQVVRLAALADGSLRAIEHQAKSCTSPLENFPEPCTGITPVMYATPNLKLHQEIATMNVGTPTFMRAPGENPGLWALESAMDELAWSLQMDPVALRLKNETQQDQQKGLPFSAKHFADCLNLGAERFGWKDRPMQTRALTRDDKLVGWGMAAATFPGYRGDTSVKVRLLPDGIAQVLTSGNDMGPGPTPWQQSRRRKPWASR
jgi:xanthine dehydrogenase YagR molybdenum-binding subunit